MQPSIPIVSEIKHGSGAGVQDPAAASSLSTGLQNPGGVLAAPSQGQPEATTPHSMSPAAQDGDTLSGLSDLSTEMQDMEESVRRAAAGGRTPGARSQKARTSTGPRDSRSLSQGKRRPVMRGRMPMSRTPSPLAQRPEIRPHVPLEPSGTDTSLEQRVQKLEEMAQRDHMWRDDVANAVKTIMQSWERDHAKLRDHDEMIGGFGRVGFDLRSEFSGMKAKLEGDLATGLEQVPTRMATFFAGGPGAQIGAVVDKLEHQILQIQAKFDVLYEHVGGAANREGIMAAKLQELDTARPQEGAAIVAALQHQAKEILDIKTVAQPSKDPAWTADKLNLLDRMYNDLVELKNIPGRLKFMEDRLTAASQDLASTSVTGVYQEIELIKVQLQEVERAAGNSPERASAGEQCQPCGGRQQGACGGWQAPCAPTPSGGAASSSDGEPWHMSILRAVTGGNGTCHCIHVKELMEKVQALEKAGRAPRADHRGPDPLQHTGWRPSATAPLSAPSAGDSTRPQAKEELPLVLKDPLGAIGYEKRAIFDEKLASLDEYKFNGVKGGLAWKGKVERHFIARAPILRKILKWAEDEELEVITPEKLIEAIGAGPYGRMTEDQVLMANTAVWGFLSTALSGSAETLFKRAEMLNGLDAWRLVTRHINHGKAIRLETLRREMKTMHLRPIHDLERVEEGIAAFENTINEYILAGGTPQGETEKKSDLKAILPAALRNALLWNSSDKGTFEEFRDMVLVQSAQVLLDQKKLPVHAVNAEPSEIEDDDHAFFDMNILQGVSNMEDLINVVDKWKQRRGRQAQRSTLGSRQQSRAPSQLRPAPATETRPPRKCPNCNEEHASTRCPKPPIAVEDRTCWSCGKKGHSSRQCPSKKTVGAVNEDSDSLRGFFVVDNEGFQGVQPRGGRRPPRPTPMSRTLGSFIDATMWDAFSEKSTEGRHDDAAAPEGPQRRVDRLDNDSKHHRLREARQATSVSGTDGHGKSRLAASDKRDPNFMGSGEAWDSPLKSCLAKPHELSRTKKRVVDFETALKEAQDIADEENGASSGLSGATLREEKGVTLKGVQSDTFCSGQNGPLNVLDYEEDEGMLAAAVESVKIKPAIDSGAVANVVHPAELPDGVEVVPNDTDTHFTGAGGGRIKRFGSCVTKLSSEHGDVGCGWQLADVTRPLHSVSTVCGPQDHPTGKQDVLFNNKKCVVVPPGIVEEILRRVRPVAQYDRSGNLYVGEMTMSPFRRQEQEK